MQTQTQTPPPYMSEADTGTRPTPRAGAVARTVYVSDGNPETGLRDLISQALELLSEYDVKQVLGKKLSGSQQERFQHLREHSTSIADAVVMCLTPDGECADRKPAITVHFVRELAELLGIPAEAV